MDLPNKNMYHFVWGENEDETEDVSQPQLSPKERVAKILQETELGDIPDLVFRSKEETDKIKKKKNPYNLSTDAQLFSIGDITDEEEDIDADYVLSNVKDPSNGAEHSIPKSQHYKRKDPAKVPPVVSVNHPKIQTPASEQYDNNNKTSDTYIVDASLNTVVFGTSSTRENKNRDSKTALLPMTGKYMRDMEFEDDMDSGVAVDDDNEDRNNRSSDTVPIVTVDQEELSEKWKQRRQKINFVIAVLLLVVGSGVLLAVILLVIFMVRGS